MPTLLPPELLKEYPDVKILDASWHMPASGRSGRKEFEQQHIPGAAFFDVDEVCDKTSSLPHMLPEAKDFAQAVGALGVSHRDKVVVYDSVGIFSAPRAWWMFRVFGHKDVAVLDGGLPAWIEAGLLLESGPVTSVPVEYKARMNEELVVSLGEMKTLVKRNVGRPKPHTQVLDARPRARFDGTAPEPRPGLRSGHMPGAKSTPFGEFVTAKGRYKDPSGIRAAFTAAGVDLSAPTDRFVATCGSGVSACVPVLALHVLGHEGVPVYDGSWSEWGQECLDTPVEKS